MRSLELILDKAREYKEGISTSTRRRNIIVNGLKSLLREAHPDSQFSAIVATVILKDTNYEELKDIICLNPDTTLVTSFLGIAAHSYGETQNSKESCSTIQNPIAPLAAMRS